MSSRNLHIRIVSPSGAIDPSYIDRAAARLRQWGFEVSEGQHARGHEGRFAGTAEQRLEDLTAALNDPQTDIILCSRGGYGLQQIIDRLPKEVGTRKTIVGFSDITLLHQWCALRGWESLHAPMCKHIAEWAEDDRSLVNEREALAGQVLHYEIEAHALNRKGEAKGTLIGGNLSVLYGLQGTPWSLDKVIDTMAEPPILMIEDIGERHYHIDRMMNNLRMSGVLGRIGGLVVGQYTDCEDDPLMGCTVAETIRAAAEEYRFPILFGFPAGHGHPNMPLWLGRETRLKVQDGHCILQQ